MLITCISIAAYYMEYSTKYNIIEARKKKKSQQEKAFYAYPQKSILDIYL